MADYCSKAGAEQLAQQLNTYWHAQGYPQAQHWVESMNTDSLKRRGKTVHVERPARMYVVRSNLVNGRPPSMNDT